MKRLGFIAALLALAAGATFADTPPPGKVSQGTPGPAASPWPMYIPQGYSVAVYLQASTAAVGTVTLAPNSSVAAVQSGDWVVSAASLPLPAGAATAALQTSGNASLTSLDSKSPALVTGRVPVDGSGVTQPVSGTFWQATQPVSGSVTAVQPTGSNLHVVVDTAPTTAVTGTFWQATQPVSAASLPLPADAASETTLSAINTKTPALSGGRVPVDGSGVTQPISGSVTATQATGSNLHVVVDTAPTTAVTQSGTWTVQPGNTANTTAWKVDGSAVTQPVSAAALPLPSGAASAANQVNTSGSFVQSASLTTVVTATVPANSVGFILEASSSNLGNIRWAVGATATTTSGMRLEPGRSSGYVPVAADITLVSESGTNEYQLTWIKH